MKISLITACCRSEGVIRTAMESVLAQKNVDLEYLVIDGGSDDGTVGIIKEYEPKFGAHGVWSCLPLIYLKYLFKIWGFVFKKG